MCSLVRYHEHLFCQFPFTKCLYFLNLSCISASAFIHLLWYCIKYQTYQNICMNQLFPPTRITTLSASQDASMTGSAYFPWEECLAMDTLSELISIFIRKIFPLRIIISERNHLHSEESASRDYFFQGEFIPIQNNFPLGICRKIPSSLTTTTGRGQNGREREDGRGQNGREREVVSLFWTQRG